MSDEAVFLTAIADHPDDDGPRLVYADWLDERGDVRGEFIRVQCELAKLPDGDARGEALRRRERQLLLPNVRGWLDGHEFLKEQKLPFRRGFVDEISGPIVDYLAAADTVRRIAPLHNARLSLPEGRYSKKLVPTWIKAIIQGEIAGCWSEFSLHGGNSNMPRIRPKIW